jgi:hypothetical protein
MHHWYFPKNRPIPQGNKVQCRIFRHREGVDKLYPSYEVFLEFGNQQIFLMSARKKKKSKNSLYHIYSKRLSVVGKEHLLGKVRSNFLGTAFTVTSCTKCNPEPENLENTQVENEKFYEELACALYVSTVQPWVFKGKLFRSNGRTYMTNSDHHAGTKCIWVQRPKKNDHRSANYGHERRTSIYYSTKGNTILIIGEASVLDFSFGSNLL